MEELRGRIKLILSEKRLSVMALAGGRGTLQVVLNNQINGTTAISANTILVVLSTFPDVSAEWLMRGTGSMLGHADIVVDNHNSHHNNMNTGNGVQNIGDAAAVIAEKDKMIAELKSDKDMLMRMLTNLTSK